MLGSKGFIFFFLFFLVVFPIAGYSQSADNANNSELNTPIAILFNESITLADITPDDDAIEIMRKQAQGNFPAVLLQARMTALTNKILEAVSLDYQQKKGIVVDLGLVEKFKQKFFNEVNTNASLSVNLDKVALKNVRQWQIEKHLYADFGGAVIFQQSNPQMPIGAYNTLLKQYSNEGKFTIELPSMEGLFWQAFEPPYRFEIAPENVDFSHPWWL